MHVQKPAKIDQAAIREPQPGEVWVVRKPRGDETVAFVTRDGGWCPIASASIVPFSDLSPVRHVPLAVTT